MNLMQPDAIDAPPRMSFLERILLGVIILEIPLRLDTHLLYQEDAAMFGAVGGINVSVTTVCLLALYAIWFWDVATLKVREASRRSWSLPLAIYVGIVGASVFIANRELLAIAYFALVFQAFLLFLYVANRLKSKQDIIFLASMLAASLALQSLLIVGSWLIVSRLQSGPVTMGPITVSAWPEGRLCGTFSTPVAAASYLALLLLPAASLLLTPVPRRVKWLALLAATSGALAICLTQTRGSLLAVALAGILFGALVCWRGWMPRWGIAAVLLLAATAVYPLSQLVMHRIVGDDHGSASSRVHLAQIAWNVIQDRPLLGVGSGNYVVAAQPYASAPPFRSEWFYAVHCTYLLEWAEVGLIGLAAFVVFLLSTVYRAGRIWQLRDPLLSVLALAIGATVLGQMGHMLVDLFNSRPYVQTLWCCAAIVPAMIRIAETSPIHDAPSEARSARQTRRIAVPASRGQSSPFPC